MAVNKYFYHTTATNEQDLVDDIQVELIQMSGIDVEYIERTDENVDYLYGEDNEGKFDKSHTLEMYLKNVDGWGGDADLISTFGLEIKEKATFQVSITRFKEETLLDRPMEGDLIYLSQSKSLLEIKNVTYDDPFYQRGKLYLYEVTCELFDYSHEEFNSINSDVDEIIDNISYEEDGNDLLAVEDIADNDEIDTEKDDIMDFSETNPYGGL